MGDLEALGLRPSGFLIDDPLCSPPSISPLLSNPSPASISNDCWQRAEKNVLEIIRLVQPTVVSEQTRKGIIEFLQELIRSNLGIQIYPFGSVPLKTYLPDGDIDLTALSAQTFEDSLANEVRAVLERAENSKDTGFVVKDVQYINAEVKLIKCLVQNIVVDISFNQLGGLSTLCLLEQVLYRFLDYYSKFDWDSFCISLYGPVPISSLPEIAAETPDNDVGELLLEKEFLRDCVDMFAVPSRGPDSNSKSFPRKNLNSRPDVPGTPTASGSTSAFSNSAAEEGPTESGSHMRPSGGLISSLEMLERLGNIKGNINISACPLVGDSSKLVISTKVDSSGGDGSATSDGSSGSSTPESDISMNSTEESVEALPDLGGDYDNHMHSLACARNCYDGRSYLHFVHSLPHMHYTANGFSHMNDVYQGPHYYHQVPPVYGADRATSRHRVHRGTGTCLPNLHNGGTSYRERYSSGRRSGPPLPTTTNNNQSARPSRDSNLAGKHVPPHERLPQLSPSQAKRPLPAAPTGFGLSPSNGNGFTSALEQVEFGSLGQFRLSSTKGSKISKLSAIISSSSLRQEVPVATRNTNQFLVQMIKGVNERNSI